MNESKMLFSFKVEGFKNIGYDDDECPLCKCKDVVITISSNSYIVEFKFGCGHVFLYKSGNIWFKSLIDDDGEIR